MKPNYSEGTWFAVPLRTGGFAVGLVARATADGPHVLAYFFGPKRASAPTMTELSDLRASSAVKVARTGDPHLIDGRWPIIGTSKQFRRDAWPFPRFVRKEEIRGKAWAVEYSEDDPGRFVAEVPIAFEAAGLDRDASHGVGAIELMLTKILG